MLLAIVALFLQPRIAPRFSYSPDTMALVQPADFMASSAAELNEDSDVTATSTTETETAGDAVRLASNSAPMVTSGAEALPDAPVPTEPLSAPAPLAFIKPGKTMTVSVDQLLAENHRNEVIWRGLVIATGSAATFDAWTTRHAITTFGARELNPVLKPFAGNSSLYAAIQVGPALMDFAGRKMMYSHHSLLRHLWWVPQSAGFVSSIFCGAHNLSYR